MGFEHLPLIGGLQGGLGSKTNLLAAARWCRFPRPLLPACFHCLCLLPLQQVLSRNAFSWCFCMVCCRQHAPVSRQPGVGSTRASDCGASRCDGARANASRPRSQSKSSCCGSTGAPAGSSKVKVNLRWRTFAVHFLMLRAGGGVKAVSFGVMRLVRTELLKETS